MFHNPFHAPISCMLAWIGVGAVYCVGLEEVGYSVRPLAERDKYVKHHRTFGGTGYVWLRSPEDAETATKILRGLDGVEAVLTRAEAAKRFHLIPERIGELVVPGDRETVFGETEPQFEVEHLSPTFRTHGSLHEAIVPLIIYTASGTLPNADRIRAHFDTTRTLYRD